VRLDSLLQLTSSLLLTAGTYTPFMLVNLRNKFAGRVVLVAVWVLALSGIFISTFLAGKYKNYRTYFYGLIGWSVLRRPRCVIRALLLLLWLLFLCLRRRLRETVCVLACARCSIACMFHFCVLPACLLL
jgi:channel protein (hemolysin III family)